MNELRLSGGLLRGRKIAVPELARPTEGRVREALFSIWGEAVAGARLLDLFAGSGAIGFEALSRGARAVVLVDSSRQAATTLGQSRDKLGIAKSEAQILTAALPAEKLPVEGSFELIFADPPYTFDRYDELLRMAGPLLAAGGEFVLEHASKAPLPAAGGGLELKDERRYGGSALGFYRHAADA
jgi:16S rRNA (guanine(966)-N(2))-methyltransferase RsmD